MSDSTDDLQRWSLPIPDLAYTGTVTYDATSPDTHYPLSVWFARLPGHRMSS